MDKPLIKWELTPDEAQYIVNVVRQRPHAECDELLKKLVAQANRPTELQVVDNGGSPAAVG